MQILLSVVVLGPWCWLFGRALSGQRTFVFRDSAHYYFPLFEWAQTQWGTGRVPLWNPQENCGVPVLAETAASVMYPPKLLFALPIPYPQQYNLFVAAHVLLAVLTAYLLARRFRASRLASTLGGLSYGFGGNVLFQYCNVVFLVGAAWLPLALLVGERLLRNRRWRWALALGAVLALMTLGGDPQSAYHALLLLGLYALMLARGRRRRWGLRLGRGRTRSGLRQRDWRLESWRLESWRLKHWRLKHGRVGLRSRPVLLLTSAAWGLALAAVQILPAMDWTRHSERAVHDAPRNLYEAALVVSQPDDEEPVIVGEGGAHDSTSSLNLTSRLSWIAQGLLGRPQPGTHHEHVFQFSVGPWRFPELLWPNISGKLFPTHRRWLNVLPAEGRVWNPSLYIGLLPVLLAACTWRPWSRRRRVAWMSWTVLLAGLGSLGWYGIGWLACEIHAGWLGREPDSFPLGPQVGGLYWLMTTVLPGYVYFRFPAKLLVVASLGLSMLAAWGWDGASGRSWRTVRRMLAGLAVLSGVGLAIALACHGRWATWLRDVSPDEFFGPLDAAGAFWDLTSSLLHTSLLAVLLGCLLRAAPRLSSSMLGAILLLVTAVDLCVAHGWSIPTAPAALWTEPSTLATTIDAHEAQANLNGSSRVFRDSMLNWRPSDWKSLSSSQRQVEAMVWERDSLFPKYNLLSDVHLVEAYGSIASADFLAVTRVARQYGSSRPDQVRQPHRDILRALNTGYYVLPTDSRIPGAVSLPSNPLPSNPLPSNPLPSNPLPSNPLPSNPLAEPERSWPADVRLWPADVRLWHDASRLDRAWIVHEVEWRAPLDRPSRQAIERRTREVYFPQGRPRPMDRQAVVESLARRPPDLAEPSDVLSAGRAEPSERCRIVVDLPDRVEVRVELARPGLLVLSDLYTEDWRAEWTTAGQPPREVPVWRTNRIMRGVALPAGRCQVVFRYRPRSFHIGAAISAAAWLLGMGLIAAWTLGGRRGRLQSGG